MMHFTYTGQYAGHTFCNKVLLATDMTCHPRVSFSQKFYEEHDVCPICESIWNEVQEEEDE